jgi:CheY-like chemotaxis protein
VVDISTDGLDGQHNIDHIHYDLIILDVMLPGKDGYSILEDLRQAKKQTIWSMLCWPSKPSVEISTTNPSSVSPFAKNEAVLCSKVSGFKKS